MASDMAIYDLDKILPITHIIDDSCCVTFSLRYQSAMVHN